jgi:hypothetical protein
MSEFALVFVLEPDATTEDNKVLGEAIYQFWDQSLAMDIGQHYYDRGILGTESTNFKGPEFQELRQGNAPESGRIELFAYDGRPHFTRAKFIEILQRHVAPDLVADVLVDGVTWDKTDE